tara:strand:- start:722 stop:1306 length:585 start_codon:yes stop_codon:yes gene_type:complete
MNFVELKNLPILDLQSELESLIDKKVVDFNKNTTQICLNTVNGKENDYEFGRGSLYYDWENKYVNDDGEVVVPPKEIVYQESDFNVLCTQFVDTGFETVYNALQKMFDLGRVRIMKSKPKTCLSWHADDHPRVHFPMQTQEGCYMVIDDTSKHLEECKWYYTNTILPHTAFNGSGKDRIHLVATIVGEKNASFN